MSNLLDHNKAPSKKTGNDTYSAKDIEVLEGLEPVRKRPGMYIGGTDEKALHHLAAEVLDNAMDEVVAGFATTIHIHLSEDGTLSVRDNGRGIPIDPHPKFPEKSALEVILTTLHSGGKFSDKAYQTAGGLHGVGLSVVNALSETLTAEIIRDKKIFTQTYHRGVPAGPLKTSAASKSSINETGTTITFHPDADIFEKGAAFKPAILYKMARSRAYLHKGVRIFWSCDPSLATSHTPAQEEFYFPDGIVDYLKNSLHHKKVLIESIFQGSSVFPGDEGRVEWALTWLAEGEGRIHSYCNTVTTSNGGTHEQGLRQAINKAIKDYGELSKNKRAAKITIDDVFDQKASIG